MMNIERLDKEEFDVAMKAIQQLREERAKSAMTQQAKSIIEKGVAMSIELVGVEQTKSIIREMNRKLRLEETWEKSF